MSDDEMDREIGAAIAANRNSGKHNYRAIYRAAHEAGMRAGIERAAEVCDDRAIVYDGLEDAASTRYFADKMRGAREGSEQCAAAIRALLEGKP